MQIERFTFRQFGGGDAFTRPADSSQSAAITSADDMLPPPEPTLTMQEVEQVRKDAYASGFRDAQKEAETKAQNEANALNKQIADYERVLIDKIQHVFNARNAIIADKQSEFSNMILAISQKVVGSAFKLNPACGVEELVEQCLQTMLGEQKLTIFVHPSLHLLMQKRLQPIIESTGFEGECAVMADDSIAKEDCVVEWKHGSASRNTHEIWHQIETLIKGVNLTSTLSDSSDTPQNETTIYLANR